MSVNQGKEPPKSHPTQIQQVTQAICSRRRGTLSTTILRNACVHCFGLGESGLGCVSFMIGMCKAKGVVSATTSASISLTCMCISSCHTNIGYPLALFPTAGDLGRARRQNVPKSKSSRGWPFGLKLKFESLESNFGDPPEALLRGSPEGDSRNLWKE